MNYNVYMPVGIRVYNVFMPTNKRVYNVYACQPDVCAGGGLLLDPNNFGPGSAWMLGGNAAVVESFGQSPECTADADKLTVGPSTSDFINQFQDVPGVPGQPLTISLQVKKITPTGILKIQNGGDNNLGEWTIDLSLLGDGWETLTPAHPAVFEVFPWQDNLAGDVNFVMYGLGSTIEYLAWCAHASVT